MKDVPISLLVGFAAGFFGAIPPGPLNITVIQKTSRSFLREAFRVALGGALIDTFLCALIGLGFGWILEKVVTDRWVKAGMALFLVAYGLKVLIVDRKKDQEEEAARKLAARKPHLPPQALQAVGSRFPFLVGILQGAANPALFVNWTLFISFAVGHKLLAKGVLPSLGFALGVGVGVFTWFVLLIELIHRLRERPIGRWLKSSAFLAGFLLVLFGLVFTWKTFNEFVTWDEDGFRTAPARIVR